MSGGVFYIEMILGGVVMAYLLRGSITSWPQYIIGWVLVLVIDLIVKKVIAARKNSKKIEYLAVEYEKTYIGDMEYRTVWGDRRANGPLLLRQLKGTDVVEWSYEKSEWSKEGIPENIAGMFFYQ